jgi:membrane fusion protein (multidrug efflux system)
MRVEAQTIPAEFEFVGVAESSHIVELRARVEGYLEQITYKEGSLVHAGDLMFVLDQRPFIAQVESAQGMLDKQNAVLWNAEQTKARMVPLYQQNAVSQRDLDNAIAEELAAKASVETASADLYKADLNLGFASITAPVTAMSNQAKFREGALISPGPDSLLTTLYVIDPIWVNFSVSDNDLIKLNKEIKLKQVVIPKDNNFTIEAILSDGSRIPATGTIDFMNPALQQSTGTMLIRAVFPNPEAILRPGQFIRVIVKGANRPYAIIIPQTAVIQGESGTFVYVVDQSGKAQMRLVELGDWYQNYWIVNKGLATGDVVVTQGVNKIQNGSQVQIQSLVPSRPSNTQP